MCDCLIMTVLVCPVVTFSLHQVLFKQSKNLICMTFVRHVLVVKGRMVLVRLLISTLHYTARWFTILRNVSRLRGTYCTAVDIIKSVRNRGTQGRDPACQGIVNQDNQWNHQHSANYLACTRIFIRSIYSIGLLGEVSTYIHTCVRGYVQKPEL